MTDDETPPPPEGFRPLSQDDLTPPPPEGFRPLTEDDRAAFKRRTLPPPSGMDRLQTSLPGAMYEGALRLGQGAEQLTAHGAALAADLLPVYPVKGSGTGKPAPHSLATMLHGIANHVDEVVGRYDKNYEAAGERVDAASPNPALSQAFRKTAEFGGSVAFPGAGALLPEVRALGAVGNAALRAGTSGAAYGAAQPALEPKSDRDYWITKAKQSGTGALTAAVLGAAGEKLTTVRGTLPTAALFRDLKNDAYRAAEASNATVPKADFIRSLNEAVADAHREVTYRANTHPETATAIRTAFDELDQYPADISFKDMDVVRRIMGSALASPKKIERSAAHVIIDGIDDHIRDLHAPEGSALLEARSLATRAFKLEAIEAAMQKARNATGGGEWIAAGAHQSHNKFDNAVRLQFAKILNTPRAARQFNADERRLMQALAHGTTTQNIGRAFGRLSPTRYTGSIIAELGGAMLGTWAGEGGFSTAAAVGAATAGMTGQKIADTINRGNVERLTNFVATGRTGLINAPRVPLRPGFQEGGQYVQNGHVYLMVNGVMVPQRRLEQ